MGLLDTLIHRDRAGATPAAAGASVMSGEPAQQARVRARRRLIGAIVLLGLGVVAFPLLFETQPRPIPVDIPIVIPPRDGAPPLALPAPKAAAPSPPVAAAASAAVAEPAPVQRAPSAVAAAPPPRPAAEAPKSVAEVRKPDSAAAKPVAAAAKPEAAAPKPAVDTAKPTASGRFVVQIGAFSEAGAVREARNKAQKAGLSTFTQTVETSNGKRTRVRLGPFGSREEAEKAAAQVKAAGLPGSVMAL